MPVPWIRHGKEHIHQVTKQYQGVNKALLRETNG